MDALDRLVWAERRSMQAYGVRFAVRVSDADAMAAVTSVLPPGTRVASRDRPERVYSYIVGGDGPRPGMRRLNLAYGNWTRLARSREGAVALDALATDLRRHVAETAPRHVFVHAGAVEWDGRAIIVPGRSFTGKTTLVEAFLRMGARYLSDEFAVLDARGRVRPFAKPLSVRPAGSDRGVDVAVGDAAVASGPVPVGAIVLTSYEPGGRYAPRRGTPGEAAMALVGNALAARRRPAHVLAAARAAAANGIVLKGRRGEAAAAARTIVERLAAGAADTTRRWA